jgi:hypothetical protein
MQQVNGIFEPLIIQMVQDAPSNNIDYMVEYIEKQFGERATNGDKQEAVTLQAKIAELEAKLDK